MSDGKSNSEIISALAEEFVERYRRGERPPVSEYTARRPELAEEIREFFAAVAMVENLALAESEAFGDADASATTAALPELKQLGDFRIIREVGRGGMGVVYEAEQISLGRNVALKVLPAAALPDDKHIKRFEREAKSAAKLHHTNIVPVFGVGAEQDLHYYVMQFIQGLPLDEVVDELKKIHAQPSGTISAPLRIREADAAGHEAERRYAVTRSLMTGQFAQTLIGPSDSDGEAGDSHPNLAQMMTEQAPQAGDTSSARLSEMLKSGLQSSQRKPFTYWKSVANIGLQVADALQYAHDQGVLHRDIKPSNLLLDLRGTAWVADFGLAKATDQQDITHTGDILGTLRYMPPEAFEGMADPRSDVYSLGLTLYELLCFQPAFGMKDRNRLVKQVTTEAAPRLEKLNPEIPRDLVTIIHKAIDRDPSHRYGSAEELKEDLKRFLDDEPIKARRISTAERLARWSRRNKGLAASLAVMCVMLIATAVAAVHSFLLAAQNEALADVVEQRARDAEAARDAAQQHVVKLDLVTARNHADRGDAGPALHWVATAWRDDLTRVGSDAELSAAADANHRLRAGNAIQGVHQLSGFCPHERPVIDADCDPTGDRVVSLNGDNAVRVWDAGRAELAFSPLEHAGKVNSAAFSALGDYIVTASDDGSARIWDAMTGQLLHTFPADAPVLRAALSPNGRIVAAAVGHSVLRWQAATGAPQGDPLAAGGLVVYVAWSSDGRRLVTNTDGAQGTAQVWDAITGVPLSDPLPSPRAVEPPDSNYAVLGAFESRRWPTFSPDGKSLVVADGFHIRVWTAEGVKEFRTHREVQPKQIEAWFAASGKLVYFVQRKDTSLFSLNPETGQINRLRSPGRETTGLRLSPDGTWAAVPRSAGNTDVYRLPSMEHVAVLPAHDDLTQFRFTRDSRRLMTASRDGAVRVWSLPGLDQTTRPYQFDGGRSHLFASPTVRRSPDGEWEAVRTTEGIRVQMAGSGSGTVLPETRNVLAFQFTARSHLIVTREDGLEAWSVLKDGPVRQGVLRDRRVVETAFSHDGCRMATLTATTDTPKQPGAKGDIVEVWELPGLRRLLGPVGEDIPRMTGVILNRDGTLVLAYQAGMVSPPCWDVATGRRLPAIRLRDGVGIPEFGEHDDRIVIHMSTWATYQWDVREGRRGGPTISNTGGQAVYSPDQSKILTISGGRLTVFDADSGELLAKLPPGSPRPQTYWFSADSSRVIFMPGADEARVWKLPAYTGAPQLLPSLVQLLTGTEADGQGGFVSLDREAILNDGDAYRRAFQAWRSGLDLSDEESSRQRTMAKLYHEAAQSEIVSGDAEAATALLARARSLTEALLTKSPDDETLAGSLADLLLADTTVWTVLKPIEMTSEGGATLTLQADASILASGENRTGDVYTIRAAAGIPEIRAIRLEALPDPSLPNHGPGRHPSGNFQLKAFRLLAAATDDAASGERLPIADARASYAYDSPDVDIRGIIGEDDSRIWHVFGRSGERHVAVFRLLTPCRIEPGEALIVQCAHTDREAGINLGRFRLSVTDDSAASEERARGHRLRGAVHVRAGQWDRAAADYAESPELDPAADSVAWMVPAALWAYAGDAERHREWTRKMAERFRASADARDPERTVKVMLLLEHGLDPEHALVEPFLASLADEALTEQNRMWFLLTRSLLACRSGDDTEARRSVDEAWRMVRDAGMSRVSEIGLTALAVQALIDAHKGKLPEAQAALGELKSLIESESGMGWRQDGSLVGGTILNGELVKHNLLIAEILRREAEQLIQAEVAPRE